MNRMRENTGVVLWILVLSFGGLWVLQDSGVFDTIGVDPLSKVIIVDGDPITFDVYNRQLQAQLDQLRQFSEGDVSPAQLENERERAFDFLVESKLREHEMDRLGLKVSEAEITDLILGPEPHEIIRGNFSSEGGTLNRQLLRASLTIRRRKPFGYRLSSISGWTGGIRSSMSSLVPPRASVTLK